MKISLFMAFVFLGTLVPQKSFALMPSPMQNTPKTAPQNQVPLSFQKTSQKNLNAYGALECAANPYPFPSRNPSQPAKSSSGPDSKCAVSSTSPPASTPNPDELSADQRRRAEQMISYFENSTVVFQYDYIENLDDGRGYTMGRAGFTTATGDAFILVNDYCQSQTKAVLCQYLPTLETLAKDQSQDIAPLEPDFVKNWKNSARDPIFRKMQDRVMENLYYRPSLDFSKSTHLNSALGKAIFYDTAIQHGYGQDPDGLPALIKITDKKFVAQPQYKEKDWLRAFLNVRRHDLLNPSNHETQKEWAASVERVDFFHDLLNQGNFELHGPILMDPDDPKNIGYIP